MARARRVLLAVLVAAMVAMATPVNAATAHGLNYDGDAPAPNPYVDVDSLTKSTHRMSWGTSDDAFRTYENDNGDVVTGEYHVNQSVDNPYSFSILDIEEDEFGAFPRKGDSETTDDADNLASALDASEWSKSGANASDLSITDTETGPNVEAVRFDTGSAFTLSSDAATATYNNWTSELDSDESKRVLQLAAQVDALDSGTTVYINVTDESGDTKTVYIDSTMNQSKDNVLANATGDHVLQVKLSDLSTSGGGAWSNIESIDVRITGGDADVSFAWIDLQKKGEAVLASKQQDIDDDDELETVDITDPHGALSSSSLSTLAPMFDDAVLHDVSAPVKFPARLVASDDAQVEWSENDLYTRTNVLDVYYRLELPAVIDLSYSGVDIMHHTEWPGERYQTVEYAEAQGDTDFDDIEDSAFVDKTGSFDAMNATVTVDSTVAAGDANVLHYEMTFSDAEKQSMTADGGAAMGPTGGGGSFWMSLPGISIIAAAIGSVVQFFRRGWPFSG